jgi:Reverse transcriptase (RNA-dependent DNA polymerase)
VVGSSPDTEFLFVAGNYPFTFILLKTIYGLVQSAREFYNKLLSTLKSMGFTENKSDPCFLSKWIDNNVVMIGIYVDDCLVVGKEELIQEVIEGMKASGFNLKIEISLKDYLSCCNIADLDSKSIIILQPHLINNLEAKFGHEVCNKRFYKTPGTPRFKVVCPVDDDDIIDAALQGRYRSIVGIILYLTKYSCPDLCNVVRELVKCMDRATKVTYLEC